MIEVTAPTNELKNLLIELQNIELQVSAIVEAGADAAKDAVQDRVEGQGLATNGSFLTTPSKTPIGRYGQRHGKARLERGLSVDKIDARFTGEMWEAWSIETKNDETRVGFNTAEARNKAENLQDWIYETELFAPSETEINENATDAMNLKINEILR